MRTHLKVLAFLYFASSALYLLGALVAATVLTGSGVLAGDRGVLALLAGLGVALAAFLTLLALPGIVEGIGLLTGRPWARPLGFVLAALNLLNFPAGTLLGGYTLWVLFQPETERLLQTGTRP